MAAFVEPGEQVTEVFLCQCGRSPYALAAIGGVIAMLFNKYRVVALTDRALLVLDASAMAQSKPRSLLARLPRDTKLGFDDGMAWGTLQLQDKKHYVHRRFFDDVRRVEGATAS